MGNTFVNQNEDNLKRGEENNWAMKMKQKADDALIIKNMDRFFKANLKESIEIAASSGYYEVYIRTNNDLYKYIRANILMITTYLSNHGFILTQVDLIYIISWVKPVNNETFDK